MTQKKKDKDYEYFLFGSERIEVEVRIKKTGSIMYEDIFKAIEQAENYFKWDQSTYR